MQESNENPYSNPPSQLRERQFSKSYQSAIKIFKRKIILSTIATVGIAFPALFLLSFVSYEKSTTTRRRHVSFLKERAMGQCIVEQIRSLNVIRNVENNAESNVNRSMESKWTLTSEIPSHTSPSSMDKKSGIDSQDPIDTLYTSSKESTWSSSTNWSSSTEKNMSLATTNHSLDSTSNEMEQYLQEKISNWVENEHEVDSKLVHTVCSHFRANYQQSCRNHFEIFYPELLEAALQNRNPRTMYMELIVNQGMTRREELYWALKSMASYFLPGGKNPVHQKFWWGEDEV